MFLLVEAAVLHELAEFYGVASEDYDFGYVGFWGDGGGVVSVDYDVCGGGVFDCLLEFLAHFGFVDDGGVSFFVFACG